MDSIEKPQEMIRSREQDHRRTVSVAVFSALAVIIIAVGLVYIFRTQIFSAVANEYLTQQSSITETANKDTNLFSDDNIVTSAVKKANPAVVAITISKDVPKYETFYDTNPLGFIFPQQRENGTENREVGNGSGFLVSSDGYIVTNKHVVEDKAAQYTVTLNDGRDIVAKIIAVDDVYDIAIIKIEGINYPYLALGDSSSLELGSTVIAIGNALGQFKNTVSVGVVSGLSRSITAGDGLGKSEQLDQVIQTDAAINPGNSGGPLLNSRGEAVGVNVAVAADSQSIGFALPINSVKGVVASVQATGKIIRPYVGVRYVQITKTLAQNEKLSSDFGILVKSGDAANPAVVKGSPAEKAGLKDGDIITHVDGRKLDITQSFAIIIREHKVGDTITLTIVRAGVEKTVQLVLEEAPQS
jgi:serine protease Do